MKLPATNLKLTDWIGICADRSFYKKNISPKTMLEGFNDYVENYNKIQKEEIHRLKLEAKMLADMYWQVNELHYIGQTGRYGTNIKENGEFFYMLWYKKVLRKGKPPLPKSLPKPLGQMKYNYGLFRYAPPWEKEIIRYIEYNYSNIRIQLQFIKNEMHIMREKNKKITAMYLARI